MRHGSSCPLFVTRNTVLIRLLIDHVTKDYVIENLTTSGGRPIVLNLNVDLE